MLFSGLTFLYYFLPAVLTLYFLAPIFDFQVSIKRIVRLPIIPA